MSIRREIGSYYDEVKAAFASQNPEGLAKLFYPGIAKPMTFPQILDWARRFFSENQAIRFHIDKTEFEDMGPGRAVVRLTYRVTTAGGKGDFGGTEVDFLEKHGGWWVMTAWKKVSAPAPHD